MPMPANIRFINPDTIAKPPGYTHVVEATGPGRLVYVAGQLGLDTGNVLVGGPGDFRAQATQAFENLKSALAAVGAGFEHVVKINNYLLDISHLGIFREVRDAYVNRAAPPASTTLQVADFARPGALFEVEAIAVLPPAKPARASSARKRMAAARGSAKTLKRPPPRGKRRR
ncbi:MAG: RidA family protein [Proteobacteria bacterium]|nr:RidA family protein [Pseudomonadota bacterium]